MLLALAKKSALYYNLGTILTSYMSQDTLIKLQSTESGTVIYSRKNKKKIKQRLELKKYDKNLKKHVTFKETR